MNNEHQDEHQDRCTLNITSSNKESIHAHPKHPNLVFILLVGTTLFLIVALGYWKAYQISQAFALGKSFKIPPIAITSIKVTEEDVRPTLDAVGSLSAHQGVMLSADLPGIVTKIDFESGTHATNGQLLAELDTHQEEAELRSANANMELAHQNLIRAHDLIEKRVIAQSSLDEINSQYLTAKATVEATQATIERKTIRAPFSGELGIRQINLGQYLKSGDPIVQLESLDPIYIDFSLPQEEFWKIYIGQKTSIQVDGLVGKNLSGNINAINSMVDISTRNVQIQATVANPKHILRPGMFADIQIILPEHKHVIMVPLTSVQFSPYVNVIYVVTSMKDPHGKKYLKVNEQPVVLGKMRGDQIEVIKGLKAGDQIATSGTFKLRQDAVVQIDNSQQPGNDAFPHPSDS